MLPVDVTRRADLEQLVARPSSRFGRLDVLVSNAGIARTGLMTELDVESWDTMIDVNLRGVLHGIAAALPVFRHQGHGHFVTTVSTSGLKIVPTQAVYAGTKNAVRTLLEALRQESTDGVLRTTSISPGYVRTELADFIEDPGNPRTGAAQNGSPRHKPRRRGACHRIRDRAARRRRDRRHHHPPDDPELTTARPARVRGPGVTPGPPW